MDDDYVDDDALFDYDRLDGDDFDEASSFSAAQSEEEYDEDLLKMPRSRRAQPQGLTRSTGKDGDHQH